MTLVLMKMPKITYLFPHISGVLNICAVEFFLYIYFCCGQEDVLGGAPDRNFLCYSLQQPEGVTVPVDAAWSETL